MNPYPVKKSFYLKTNRPDLLKFKEEGLMVCKKKRFCVNVRCNLQKQSVVDVLKNFRKTKLGWIQF